MKTFALVWMAVVAVLMFERSALAQGVETVALPGDVIGGKRLVSMGHASINDSGFVVFSAFVESNGQERNTILTRDSIVVTDGDIIAGQPVGVGRPALNDAGSIIWRGRFGNEPGGILTQNGPMIEVGDNIDGKTLTQIDSLPSINDSGQVIFRGVFPDGFGIFTDTQMLVQNGSIVAGKTLTGIREGPSINDDGDFVFAASFAGGDGLFLNDTLLYQTGSIVGGKTLTEIGEGVSINDAGDVAFRALFAGGQGIFRNDELFIQSGIFLNGKLVAALGNPSLNDSQQIAFLASFTDGSDGVFVFTIPEPSTIVLAIIAAVVAFLYGRAKAITT